MDETSLIRVLVVDDHAMTRAGIKFYIEQDPRIKVIAEASTGEESIGLSADLSPDVVVMDLYMPITNGIEASKKIRNNNPNTKIIILTSHSGKNEVSAALSAGINGYCLKDVSNERLVSAINSVFNGDIWIDSSIATDFLCLMSPQGEISLNGGSNSTPNPSSDRFSLTERELAVLGLIVSGKTNQEIASVLFLSVDTIKSHLKTIMTKLNVNDRTQAAVKAVREGLIR